MLVALVLMVINFILGWYVAIRLGYGPPNWQTALNLIIRMTTLQDYLNVSRDWIDRKAPLIDKLLNRLHVPKPIIFINTSPAEETDDAKQTEESADSQQSEEFSDAPLEQLLGVTEPQSVTG